VVKLFASTLRARDEDEEEDEPTKETAQARPLFLAEKTMSLGSKTWSEHRFYPKHVIFPIKK
jgi:hypothetical protein